MAALVVTNMYPSPARLALGSFVRDQVRTSQRIDWLNANPRVRGRARALEFRAGKLAQRVADAWRGLASGGRAPPLYSPAEAPTERLRGAPPS
jgi:hypothetical protein